MSASYPGCRPRTPLSVGGRRASALWISSRKLARTCTSYSSTAAVPPTRIECRRHDVAVAKAMWLLSGYYVATTWELFFTRSHGFGDRLFTGARRKQRATTTLVGDKLIRKLLRDLPLCAAN